MNKTIISIIIGTILIAGIIGVIWWYSQESSPTGRCGDDVCDKAEQTNPKLCPKDCKPIVTETCSQLGGTSCSFRETCSGSWLYAIDTNKCCSGECQTVILSDSDSPFGVSSAFDPYFLTETSRFEDLIEKQFEYTADIGAGWYRAHIPFPFRWGHIEKSEGNLDFSKTDILVRKANNIQVLAQLFPFAEWDQAHYGDDPDCLRTLTSDGPKVPSCGPYDREKYKNFVKKTVRQHKDYIKYWEIMNEPGSMYLGQARGGAQKNPDFVDELTDDYIEVLRISYEAIKEECDDCIVLLAGLVSPPEHGTPLIEREKLSGYLLEKGASEYFDIYNFHCYDPDSKGIYYQINDNTAILKKYDVQKPIWVTEVGENIDQVGSTESTQSQILVRQYVILLANNVDKVFFHSLTGTGYGLCRGAGLGVTDEVECRFLRLSYYTYKLMTERLDGSDWDNIETIIDGKDNIYAYKFTKQGEPVWIVWWDYFEDAESSKTVSLDVGNINSVKITEAVPDAESGDELDENEYPNFFNTETKSVSNGQVTLTLGESPVFVEMTP